MDYCAVSSDADPSADPLRRSQRGSDPRLDPRYRSAFRSAEKGFTIIELLLVIALTTVLAALSLPVYQRFQVQNDLDVAVDATTHSLRRAQLLARAGQHDSQWGVSIDPGNNNAIVLFKGDSFSNRDTQYDETFDFPSSLNVSGVTEVVFSKLKGEPSVTGSVTLVSSTNETWTITINEKGTISNP